MPSFDAIPNLQPEEEVSKNNTLHRISRLPDAEAVALIPRMATMLAHEATAWTQHCAATQSKSYITIVTQAHVRGVDINAVKAAAIIHVLETMPARFAALARVNRCEPLEPLSKTLTDLRDQVRRVAAQELDCASHRRVVYDVGLVKEISELEEAMEELENTRLERLRQTRLMLLGTRRLEFTSAEHVNELGVAMEELAIDVESTLVD